MRVNSSTWIRLCSTKRPVGSPAASLTISTPFGAAVARVRVDEAGHDGGAAKVHDARAAVAPPADLGAAAGRDDAPAGDGERAHDRPPRIEREDVPVVENEVSGYFIQPFSRYAFSAPGCSGMPTLSTCHAVFG